MRGEPQRCSAVRAQRAEALSSPKSRAVTSGGYRCRRGLVDQSAGFQLLPELGRDLGLHGIVVLKNLLIAAGADHQGDGDVRRRRELKCRGAQVDSVAGGDRAQPLALLEMRRRDLVVLLSVVV